MNLIRTLLFMVIVSGYARSQIADPEGWIVSVGDPIPNLSLTDSSGKQRNLDEFLGSPVLLLFWGSS